MKQKYIYIIFVTLLTYPLTLIILKPIKFPFADDWLVIGANSGMHEDFYPKILQNVNGHQIALSKILIKLLGMIDDYRIQYISLSSIILGSIGILLLIQSQVKLVNDSRPRFFLALLLVTGLSYKQMQNFFMPICNGWMVAIFFIGLFYFAKNNKEFPLQILVISSTVLLAPLSMGIGIVLPILILIESLYLFQKNHKLTRNQIKLVISSLSSFLLLSIIDLIRLKDASGSEHEFDFSTVISGIKNPLGIISFLLAVIGSPFVPSNRWDPISSIIAGATFLSLLVIVIIKNKTKIQLASLLTNQNCLLGGVVYLAILVLYRFDGSYASIANIVSPRYLTGTVIFLIGSFVVGVKLINPSKARDWVIVTLILSIFFAGFKTGNDWHEVRYTQSQLLFGCELNQFENSNDYCSKLLFQNSMSPSKEFLLEALKKFKDDKQ